MARETKKDLQNLIKMKDSHLKALAEMSVNLNAYRSLSDMLVFVSEKTRDLVGVERVSVMLVDPGMEEMSIVASSGVSEEVVAKLRFKLGEGVAGKAWKQKKPVLIKDTSKTADYQRIEQKDQPPPSCLLSVPIMDRNEFFGVINVQRPVEWGVFDNEAVNLVTLIASLTGGSIRYVRLVSDLENQIKNIRAAQEIGNLLVSTFDLDTVLTLIVRGIRDVMGAEVCSIMMWDETEDYLVIRASEGLPEDVVREARVKRGENIAGWVAQEGRPLLIRNLDEDPRFKPSGGKRYSSNCVLSVPLKAKGQVLGVINVNNLRNVRIYNASDQNLLMLFANQAAIALENARLYREIEKLAITDGLTGLANHRAFQERLMREISRAARFMMEVSLLIFDIDFFKSINDQHGHLVGDHVLRCVGQTLQHMVRKMDFVARYGGEEFAVIMPQTRKEEAVRIADRLRQELANRRWIKTEPDRSVTISVGVAEYPTDAGEAQELIDVADRALYVSKNSGRNRVTSANSPEMLAEEAKGTRR